MWKVNSEEEREEREKNSWVVAHMKTYRKCRYGGREFFEKWEVFRAVVGSLFVVDSDLSFCSSSLLSLSK